MYLLSHQEILEKNPRLLLYASSEKAILDAIKESQTKKRGAMRK